MFFQVSIIVDVLVFAREGAVKGNCELKQDLMRTRNLYQVCDLLIEVYHTFIYYF